MSTGNAPTPATLAKQVAHHSAAMKKQASARVSPTKTSTPAPSPKKGMPYDQMVSVIKSARPGDKLRIIFADKPVDKVRIVAFLGLTMTGIGGKPALAISDWGLMDLVAVADYGDWHGFRSYDVTVLESFDVNDFVTCTQPHELFESITKLA